MVVRPGCDDPAVDGMGVGSIRRYDDCLSPAVDDGVRARLSSLGEVEADAVG